MDKLYSFKFVNIILAENKHLEAWVDVERGFKKIIGSRQSGGQSEMLIRIDQAQGSTM
jgi:hypothetical protein